MTSRNHPSDAKGGMTGAVGAGAPRAPPHDCPESKQTPHPKPDVSTISNRTSEALND
jgi:hypothetical protein